MYIKRVLITHRSSQEPLVHTNCHKTPVVGNDKRLSTRLSAYTRKLRCAGRNSFVTLLQPLDIFSRWLAWRVGRGIRGVAPASICHYGRFVLVRTVARPSGPRYGYRAHTCAYPCTLSFPFFLPFVFRIRAETRVA